MKYLLKGFVLAAIVVIGTATISSVEAISFNHVICSILICGNKKEQLVKSCSFFVVRRIGMTKPPVKLGVSKIS